MRLIDADALKAFIKQNGYLYANTLDTFPAVDAAQIEWKDSKNDPPDFFGWYLVALLPVNHKDLTVDQINHWRESFGCSKAWYNPNAPKSKQWFEPDAYGRGCREITERVTHWARLLSVPAIPEISNN